MGTLGTLYVKNHTRVRVPAGLARTLDIGVTTAAPNATYHELFPLGKHPAFVGDGFILTETIAISAYFARKGAPELLGRSDEEFAQILRWASFANSDIMAAAYDATAGVEGKIPYNAASTESGVRRVAEYSQVLENELTSTYFVGDNLTLADLIVAQTYYKVFKSIVDRNEYPKLARWFDTVKRSKYIDKEFAGI